MAAISIIDCFNFLELPFDKSITIQDVTNAYKNLAKKYHPDKNPPEKKDEFEEKFKKLTRSRDKAIEYIRNQHTTSYKKPDSTQTCSNCKCATYGKTLCNICELYNILLKTLSSVSFKNEEPMDTSKPYYNGRTYDESRYSIINKSYNTVIFYDKKY